VGDLGFGDRRPMRREQIEMHAAITDMAEIADLQVAAEFADAFDQGASQPRKGRAGSGDVEGDDFALCLDAFADGVTDVPEIGASPQAHVHGQRTIAAQARAQCLQHDIFEVNPALRPKRRGGLDQQEVVWRGSIGEGVVQRRLMAQRCKQRVTRHAFDGGKQLSEASLDFGQYRRDGVDGCRHDQRVARLSGQPVKLDLDPRDDTEKPAGAGEELLEI
jgi:hypothetical protein